MLGSDDILHIIQYLSNDDRLRLALICKHALSRVDVWCHRVIQKVVRHHIVSRPAPSTFSDPSFRRELQWTMSTPRFVQIYQETKTYEDLPCPLPKITFCYRQH